MPERPSLTIAQVVAQFDISRATVRRGIESGRFPGAHKDVQGRWLVPVDDLIGEHIKPRRSWINDPAHEGGHPARSEQSHGAEAAETVVASEHAQSAIEHAQKLAQRDTRIAQLEAQLGAEKQLRAAAERNADDLRAALRMLEVAPATARAQAPVAAVPNPADETQPRRRWWQRG